MQLATWAQTLPVILMIVLAVYLPGSIVGLLAGRRGVDLVALAPVISIAIAGVGGVVVYPLGVRLGLGSLPARRGAGGAGGIRDTDGARACARSEPRLVAQRVRRASACRHC